jgi:ribosomal protein L16/L10AE
VTEGQGLPLQFVAELRHVAALLCFECRSRKARNNEENMRISCGKIPVSARLVGLGTPTEPECDAGS